MNSRCGIAPSGSRPTPRRPANASPPANPLPPSNASEYPTSAHATATVPIALTLIIIVLSVFLERTSPP